MDNKHAYILDSDPWVSYFMLDLYVSLFDNMQSCTAMRSFRVKEF